MVEACAQCALSSRPQVPQRSDHVPAPAGRPAEGLQRYKPGGPLVRGRGKGRGACVPGLDIALSQCSRRLRWSVQCIYIIAYHFPGWVEWLSGRIVALDVDETGVKSKGHCVTIASRGGFQRGPLSRRGRTRCQCIYLVAPSVVDRNIPGCDYSHAVLTEG